MNATSNDAELEAALLSLDQSQLTQNLMKEFINAGNQSIISEGGNAQRKTSVPIIATQQSTNEQ